MRKRARRCDPQKQGYWRDVVRRCEQSGRSVRAFCAAAGVNESAFYWWRRRLARRRQEHGIPGATSSRVTDAKRNTPPTAASRPSSPSAGRFLPIQLVMDHAAPEESGVEICLPGCRRVALRAGFDAKTLADALTVLEGRAC